MQIDRMAKELQALKASVSELKASHREMAATLAAVQDDAKRRAAEDDLQSTRSPSDASARASVYSNALSIGTPPAAIPPLPQPRAVQTPRSAPPPVLATPSPPQAAAPSLAIPPFGR